MNIRLFTFTLSVLILAVSPVLTSDSAADIVIYDLDFETQAGGDPNNYNSNYDQADNGGSSISYPDSTGDDGSRTMQVDFGNTGSPFSVSYFTNLASSSVNAGTSADLSEYVLSFDIRAEGFAAGESSVNTQYQLTIGDVVLRENLNTTTAYQNVEINLGAMTNVNSTSFELADFGGTQQFRVALLDSTNKFGVDTDNLYQLDNIRIEQMAVPEPGSLGLIALGSLALTCRRRRTA